MSQTTPGERIESFLHRFFGSNVGSVLGCAIAPPDIDDSPEYRSADDFSKTIEATEGVDYGWVWDYAKDLYDREARIFKELDEKANDIIKYLGGGTGLFTLAVIANIKPDNVLIVLWTIPSFVLAVLSVFFAALVRQPNDTALPPSIKDAFDYANAYKDEHKAKATFVGKWHLACLKMLLAVQYKSARVRLATWFFFAAIAALAIPVGVAVIRFM